MIIYVIIMIRCQVLGSPVAHASAENKFAGCTDFLNFL